MEIWPKHDRGRWYDKENTNQIIWYNSSTDGPLMLNCIHWVILENAFWYRLISVHPKWTKAHGDMTKTWWQKWYNKIHSKSNFVLDSSYSWSTNATLHELNYTRKCILIQSDLSTSQTDKNSWKYDGMEIWLWSQTFI
jgi:hypothetical protein